MSLTLNEWLDIIQTGAMVAAAGFAVWQIKVAAQQLTLAATEYRTAAEQTAIAARASSATTVAALAAASRELQWKILEDKALHPLLVPSAPAAGLSPDQKMDLVRGMLISHYSFIF